MIKKIFAVYDSKANVYSNPFYAVNAAVALRDFKRAAMDTQSDLNKFPADYCLTEFGSFNDEDGTFDIYVQPQRLGFASQYLEG